MCWKVGNNTKSPFLKANPPCEIIHLTFRELCTGADLFTLLDLLDHVRGGVFVHVLLVATRRSSRTAAHADQVEAPRA